MGWSCSAVADETLKLWTKHCVSTHGSQNTYRVNGVEYFFDVSRREYDDGRICGTVYRMESDGAGRGFCRKVSTFRINGDGTVDRAPAVLKALGVGVLPTYGRLGDGRLVLIPR